MKPFFLLFIAITFFHSSFHVDRLTLLRFACTDLDAATQLQIDRGKRLVEILKQDQYKPMPVEEQVAIIFAGAEGLLDKVPVELIKRFEENMLEELRGQHDEILESIRSEKMITDDNAKALTKVIGAYRDTFVKVHDPDVAREEQEMKPAGT